MRANTRGSLIERYPWMYKLFAVRPTSGGPLGVGLTANRGKEPKWREQLEHLIFIA